MLILDDWNERFGAKCVVDDDSITQANMSNPQQQLLNKSSTKFVEAKRKPRSILVRRETHGFLNFWLMAICLHLTSICDGAISGQTSSRVRRWLQVYDDSMTQASK